MAIWNFSENSPVLEAPPVHKTSIIVGVQKQPEKMLLTSVIHYLIDDN